MTASAEPLDRLTGEAIAVLTRELGVARTLRFLAQYRTGHGDYTAERTALLSDDPPLDTLLDQARRLDEDRRGRCPLPRTKHGNIPL